MQHTALYDHSSLVRGKQLGRDVLPPLESGDLILAIVCIQFIGAHEASCHLILIVLWGEGDNGKREVSANTSLSGC